MSHPETHRQVPESRRLHLSRREWLRWTAAASAVAASGCTRRRTPSDVLPERAVVTREFIYLDAPFPECHASTLVETRDGLLASWFGGTRESHPDVCIYTTRRGANGWSAPEKVADGLEPGGERRHPCWNPVLFQPASGPLLLFYKVGPRPNSWWGMLKTSDDQGRTWSVPHRLPDGFLGPIRAKPVSRADGSILCGSSTEHAGWRVHMEFTTDPLRAWEKTGFLNEAAQWGAIQPTILRHGGGTYQILCRSRQGVIVESWSHDHGRTWGPMTATSLPNPSSGIDALRLADGRFLLVYNPTRRGRGVISLALSRDGRDWAYAGSVEREPEPAEFSYPAMIQARDGTVHLTYTWKRRRLRHLAIHPTRLREMPMPPPPTPTTGRDT